MAKPIDTLQLVGVKDKPSKFPENQAWRWVKPPISLGPGTARTPSGLAEAAVAEVFFDSVGWVDSCDSHGFIETSGSPSPFPEPPTEEASASRLRTGVATGVAECCSTSVVLQAEMKPINQQNTCMVYIYNIDINTMHSP